jgi:hypothetical protein
MLANCAHLSDSRFARTKDAIQRRFSSTTSLILRKWLRQPESSNRPARKPPDSWHLASSSFSALLCLLFAAYSKAPRRKPYPLRIHVVRRSHTHVPCARADPSDDYSPVLWLPFAPAPFRSVNRLLPPIRESFAGNHYSTPLITVEAIQPNRAEQARTDLKSQASPRRRLSILHVMAGVRNRAPLVQEMPRVAAWLGVGRTNL